MEWIEVSSSLPKAQEVFCNSKPVLAYHEGNVYVATCIPATSSWYDYYRMGEGSLRNVTHWRNLPNPPKED